jgi:hypothetical protein
MRQILGIYHINRPSVMPYPGQGWRHKSTQVRLFGGGVELGLERALFIQERLLIYELFSIVSMLRIIIQLLELRPRTRASALFFV